LNLFNPNGSLGGGDGFGVKSHDAGHQLFCGSVDAHLGRSNAGVLHSVGGEHLVPASLRLGSGGGGGGGGVVVVVVVVVIVMVVVVVVVGLLWWWRRWWWWWRRRCCKVYASALPLRASK
jgi:hypothetical protein